MATKAKEAIKGVVQDAKEATKEAVKDATTAMKDATIAVKDAASTVKDALTPDSSKATIFFSIPYKTIYGETLNVSGTGFLGGWETSHVLKHNNGVWSLALHTPAQATDLEYKYFMKNSLGEHWEGGVNRVIHSKDLKAGTFIELRDEWRTTSSPESTFLDSSLFRDAVFHRDQPTAVGEKASSSDSTTLRFEVLRTVVDAGDRVYVSGSNDTLGNWDKSKAVPLGDATHPIWSVDLSFPNNQLSFEYKYLIIRGSDNSVIWETGPNRRSSTNHSEAPASATKKTTIFGDGDFRGPSSWRGAGVAVPIFSLRTKSGLGVGEFLDLKLLVDWAAKCKLNLIQILPISDTTVYNDYRDSYPYSAVSVFALHPMYIRIDAVTKDPVILKEVSEKREILNKLPQVDYEEMMRIKTSLLHRIFEKESKTLVNDKDFLAFIESNKEWLVPYALFCEFMVKYGSSDFSLWHENATVSQKQIEELSSPKSPYYQKCLYNYFVQYHLHLQLLEASTYAKQHRIGLKGDLPIGVNRYSVDTWVYPNLFKMNKSTGAPPDAFADDGQNWGFPTYAWDVMAKDNYAWWRARLGQMAKYFHAFRIDHILGFFRIWEIPAVCVTGLLGKFSPALPIYRHELNNQGVWDVDRLVEPYIRWHILEQFFGDKASYVADKFLSRHPQLQFQLKPEYDSEKKIRAALSPDEKHLEQGLFRLTQNVVLLREEGNEQDKFHPRIELQKTTSYRDLDAAQKHNLHNLYISYFYQRQEELWSQIGFKRLPIIRSCTKMLVCGEDLGMVPKCVTPVLNQIGILGLRIQRMPGDPTIEFYHPHTYDYLTVASTSSHDMSTLRGWWEEDRVRSQRFYNTVLGIEGQAPYFCEAYISRAVLNQHLHSASMWAIFPLQDLFGIDSDLSKINPHEQKINEPSNPTHYWRYRMHVTLEDLVNNTNFNDTLKGLVTDSNRSRA